MKPPALFKLCTFGLVATSSYLLMRPSSTLSHRSPGPEQTVATASQSATLRSRHAIVSKPPASTAQTPLPFNAMKDPESHSTGSDPAPTVVPLAIQLADDVRLPAALMPSEAIEMPDAVTAATQEISDRYYQELQASAARPSAAEEDQKSSSEENSTRVIANSPEAEQIRYRADQQFRVLHGDERYNQQILNSAIEVMLPIDTE
jgi:hypothetical protein